MSLPFNSEAIRPFVFIAPLAFLIGDDRAATLPRAGAVGWRRRARAVSVFSHQGRAQQVRTLHPTGSIVRPCQCFAGIYQAE